MVDVGTDIVEVPRIQDLMTKHEGGFQTRYFTEKEQAYCDKKATPAIHYAGRFAVKEAVIKILGAQKFKDMEVINREDGKPLLYLHGEAMGAAEARGVYAMHITISHTKEYATAVAIAEMPTPRGLGIIK